uniref:Regulator of chromosome condensation protein n=1 Tax=Pithovirus LCPAC202 TaxID=2506592 RepID=A0A481Z5N5_9VIRU|nr:MAG: regulator of chromosome condensation protein [Pithovirus LCPAC202]
MNIFRRADNIFLFKMEPPLNLSDLPPETITELLYNIKDLKTLANLCQTDKRIHAICENEMFWKEKYRRDFLHLPLKSNLLSWKEQYKLTYTVPISPISAGYGTHAIIDDENMLYMGGNSSLYGFHDDEGPLRSQNVRRLAMLPTFQQKVRSVSNADVYIGAVTGDGKVYFWGTHLGNILGEPEVLNPTEFKIPGKAIKISCDMGEEMYAMFAVILEDRSVFLRMNYAYYDHTSGSRLTKTISATFDIKAVDISVNGHALAIVSTDGKLYYLGKRINKLYEQKPSDHIGVIYKDGQIVVNPVHIPLPETIKQVSMGDRNICVLSTKGNIYLWGNNEYGQLGQGAKLGPTKNVDSPLKLTFPAPISFINCRHSVSAAIDENGKLYIWGRNTISAKSSNTADQSKYINLGDIYIKPSVRLTSGFNRPIEIGLVHYDNNIESMFNYVSIGSSHVVATTKDGYVNVWDSTSY